MRTKLTLLGKDPKSLPEGISLAGPIQIDWTVTEFNEGGLTKYRRQATHHPIRIALLQCLGLDETLHKLSCRTAGFGLKITFVIDLQDAQGNLVDHALVDVDLHDLVPDDFVIGETLALHLITKTSPVINWNPGGAR